MIINLDEVWFLDCDERSVTLTERRVIQAKEEGAKGIAPKPENVGKIREAQHGFYASVTDACQGYLKKSVVSMDGMMTATALIAAWNEAAARVEAACRTIPKRGVQTITLADASDEMEAAKVIGHKGPVSFNSGVLVADGAGGVVEFPTAKGPDPLFTLPQA